MEVSFGCTHVVSLEILRVIMSASEAALHFLLLACLLNYCCLA